MGFFEKYKAHRKMGIFKAHVREEKKTRRLEEKARSSEIMVGRLSRQEAAQKKISALSEFKKKRARATLPLPSKKTMKSIIGKVSRVS